jgi:3-methyl-2-oxobutanoate hydroxymethyltransferase
MNILDFQKMKDNHEKITMVTCYDYCFAKLMADTDIDCILVGDSLSMVMHGHKNTIPATIDLMALHTQAVSRGVSNKFIIGDLPFLSYRSDLASNMNAVGKLMQAGAQAVKLEGATGNEALVAHIVESGVPVMGHLGLTPQMVHQLGGFRVQGKEDAAAQLLIEQAKKLQDAGIFALVLECIPSHLAKRVTQSLSIPTIGIGAGVDCDGQVLVLHDLLGFYPEFQGKFVKPYLDGQALVTQALNQYNDEVKKKVFPEDCHSF